MRQSHVCNKYILVLNTKDRNCALFAANLFSTVYTVIQQCEQMCWQNVQNLLCTLKPELCEHPDCFPTQCNGWGIGLEMRETFVWLEHSSAKHLFPLRGCWNSPNLDHYYTVLSFYTANIFGCYNNSDSCWFTKCFKLNCGWNLTTSLGPIILACGKLRWHLTGVIFQVKHIKAVFDYLKLTFSSPCILAWLSVLNILISTFSSLKNGNKSLKMLYTPPLPEIHPNPSGPYTYRFLHQGCEQIICYLNIFK